MKRTWCSRLLGNIRYYSSEEAMSIIISNWYDSLTTVIPCVTKQSTTPSSLHEVPTVAIQY